MLFTTNYVTEQTDQVTRDVRYLPAGIHENIKLTSVRVDKSPNLGANFIEFTFKDEAGNSVTSTEFEPTKRADEDDLVFAKRVENLMRRILQIVRIYTNQNYEANSFVDMANWIKEKLDPAKNPEILVRLKVIYEWSEKKQADYTRLPKYSQYTFIEPMTIPQNNSKIKILTIDKIQREYIPDKELQKNNQFAPLDQDPRQQVKDLPFEFSNQSDVPVTNSSAPF